MNNSIQEFLVWASTEGGRNELVDAIHGSEQYSCFDESVARTILDDHLNTVTELGVIVGAPRIRILVEEYSPSCPSALAVPDEELAKLEEHYSPTAHR